MMRLLDSTSNELPPFRSSKLRLLLPRFWRKNEIRDEKGRDLRLEEKERLK